MEALKFMERKYYGWKGRLNFLRIVRDPNDTPAVLRMNAALQKSTSPEVVMRFMERAYADPKLEAAFAANYWPALPEFPVLEAMAPGTFGRALADFINKWNLDKDLFPPPNFSSRPDYLLSRVYQAHDAWHVLTGYDPVVEDELALQAFGVGQYKQPLSLLLVSGGLLHILDTMPERAEDALAAVAKGFERGRRAKNLLTEPVLERMGDPLECVRRELGF